MAAYFLVTDFDGVRRRSDGAWIPNDAGNTDWRAYLTWLGAGNTPDPAQG